MARLEIYDEAFFNGRVALHQGDCMAVIATLADSSIDSVVTDPPYGLGFMGKQWDSGTVAFDATFWVEALRVLKPGAHLLAMGGTRTYHRLACAIEDAGFEIRDQLAWVYGSGFPKSHNIGNGWGTALKPAWEPICLARKPLIGTVAENVLAHGTGAINIDGCRVGTDEITVKGYRAETGATWLGSGMLAANVERTPTTHRGRWPANIVHDGSDEVLAGFPETQSGSGERGGTSPNPMSWGEPRPSTSFQGDAGSAARFFYTTKADAHDRIGSKHPTVKPVDLMQWLVRLVTPKGGTVLDPFAGTGTTGEAAWREGCRAILIERQADYCADIHRRMELALKPAKRVAVAKSKGRLMGAEGTPLFADIENADGR